MPVATWREYTDPHPIFLVPAKGEVADSDVSPVPALPLSRNLTLRDIFGGRVR
jgi:hypothetical protein